MATAVYEPMGCAGLNGNRTSIPADADQDKDEEEPKEAEPEVDITINNVVCSFNVRCHLNLREIALNGINVEYRKENGMVTMKLRHPYTTANIWNSGKITCTGANSEDQARIAARRFARQLQKLGFNTRFTNYRVVNVLGTVTLPFAIRITQFSRDHPNQASYEPELHPGVTYRCKDPKATLKIFSTGSITITAPSVTNVRLAVEHIYPLVSHDDYKKPKSKEDISEPIPKILPSKGEKRKKSTPQVVPPSKRQDQVYVRKKPAVEDSDSDSDDENVSDESLSD